MNKLNKYIGIFKFAFKKQINFKLNYFTTLFSFGIHIFVFSCLWDYVLQGKFIVRVQQNRPYMVYNNGRIYMVFS